MAAHDPWPRKHAPKQPQGVIGQADAVRRILAYVQGHRRGAKPVLLAGPPGVGKTTLVHVIAMTLDRELIEINASDDRGKEAIAGVIGQAAFQTSLFARERIILIDEVDGISGTADRGGIPALLDILPRSAHPVVLTANDLEADKLKALRKACEVIVLAPPTHTEIAALLKRIALAEGVTLGDDVTLGIARRCGGDVRAALTDLQAIAQGDDVPHERLDSLDARDTTVAIEDAIVRVLKTTSADIARGSYDAVDEEPGTLLHWIDESLARAYPGKLDLARAYRALSDADVYLGRIRRWQHYRYYVYVYDLLTAGVATAKDSKHAGAIAPKQPQRFLRLWMANQRNAKRKKLAEQLSSSLHTSTRRVRQDVLPYLRYIAKRRGEAWVSAAASRYGIDEEAASWLAG